MHASPQASHRSGTQGLAVGLDNGTVEVFMRETDEGRTLTKLRTLTMGANMGRVRAPAQEPGIVSLGPRGVSQVAVAPSEEGLAVCTRDRQLLLVNTVGLLEGTQARRCHALAAACLRCMCGGRCCMSACRVRKVCGAAVCGGLALARRGARARDGVRAARLLASWVAACRHRCSCA